MQRATKIFQIEERQADSPFIDAVWRTNFTVYVEDRDNPGNGTDRIWLSGPGGLVLPGTLATAKNNATELTGGNIAVPHKAGSGKKK